MSYVHIVSQNTSPNVKILMKGQGIRNAPIAAKHIDYISHFQLITTLNLIVN